MIQCPACPDDSTSNFTLQLVLCFATCTEAFVGNLRSAARLLGNETQHCASKIINMFHGNFLLTKDSQDEIPGTTDQALEGRSITQDRPSGEVNGHNLHRRPLLPESTRTPRPVLNSAEADRAGTSQAVDHRNANIKRDSTKRRSSADAAFYRESTGQNMSQSPLLESTGPGSGTKRRRVSDAPGRAVGPSGPARAGPSGWSASTSGGAGVDTVFSATLLAERSRYSNNLDGAHPSCDVSASSTYGDEAEVLDLISSNDSSPGRLWDITRLTNHDCAPPEPKLKLRLKQPQLVQLHQPHYMSSCLDAQGSPYPSPYTASEPPNSILAYDAARAKKGTPLQPTAQAGKEDKYTSVLEHDLAITKTRLAKANDRLKRLERVEKEKEAFKEENEKLRSRVDRLLARIGDEGEGRNHCEIADQAAADATSYFSGS